MKKAKEENPQMTTEVVEKEKRRYAGVYNRLFPMKASMNTFITIYILHLLQKEKMYGKEVINKISDRFNGHWQPSHGMIYPILRELEEEGLVKGKWIGDTSKKTMRVYQITSKGREAYNKQKETHKDLFVQSFNVMETMMGDLYEEYRLIDLDDDK